MDSNTDTEQKIQKSTYTQCEQRGIRDGAFTLSAQCLPAVYNSSSCVPDFWGCYQVFFWGIEPKVSLVVSE